MSNPVVPALAAAEESAARGAALALAIAMALLGLLVACCPLDTLLSRFHPDDVFYYYNTARIFAATGFSSFDGLHFTNGYQPLWFVVCTTVFLVFPAGGETPLRVLLLVQVALAAAATFLLVRLVARRFSPIAAAVGAVPFVMVAQTAMTNGLETALLMFCLALLLSRWQRCIDRPAADVRPSDLVLLGSFAGLTFLARTDSAFLIAALAVAAWWRLGFSRWRRLACFAVPLAVLAGGYLLSNLALTGHLMPVSGAAKIFHSREIRHAAVAGLGKTEAWLQNLFWPFQAPHRRYIAFALAAPPVLIAIGMLRRSLRELLAPAAGFWPLWVGAFGSWVFYGTAFWGGFSQTGWYYPPHAFLACVVLATVDAATVRAMAPHLPRGLVALVGVAWLLGADDTSWLALPCLGVALLAWSSLPRVRATIAVATIGALALVVFAAEGQGNEALLTGLLIAVASTAIVGPWSPRCAAIGGAVAIAALTTLRQGRVVEGMIREGPTNWNWNLYLGALWARDNLPLDATVWSGSAGILGYFSERTVVNTDGLANSFEFLDGVLRAGKLHEFEERWDFAIDAMADDSFEQAFPGGRFVPLPPELSPRRVQFADGGLTRSLRVYEMKGRGRPWPPEPVFAITAPGVEYRVGAKVPLRWTLRSVLPGARVSLCHDRDGEWNGNEQWIFVDAVAAVPGETRFEWDTTGLAPGEYAIAGYVFDVPQGRERWTRARAVGRIVLRP